VTSSLGRRSVVDDVGSWAARTGQRTDSTVRSASRSRHSLHRHYPASAVLRASPPPQGARPIRHRSSVGRPRPRQGASRVACAFLVYVVATTPAQPLAALTAHPSRDVSLPRKGRRVGLCIVLFEAFSAFTRVTARTLALPPIRGTLYPKASDISSPPCPLRSLPAGAFAGWGLHPLDSAAFARRAPTTDIRSAGQMAPKRTSVEG